MIPLPPLWCALRDYACNLTAWEHRRLRVKAMECAGLIGASNLRLPLSIRPVHLRFDALTTFSQLVVIAWDEKCTG